MEMLTVLDTKLIAILAVSVGSLIFGFIPAILGLGSRCKDSVILSCTLCFGGGVLFATSIVHILPDARENLPKWSELLFCLGFFFIYFIDVVISIFNGNHHQMVPLEEPLVDSDSRTHYGTVDLSEPFVTITDIPSRDDDTQRQSWNCMNFGLIIAFSVHALLEGLVIGIQDSPNGVLLLLGAVCSHKLLVAFCLGAELVADRRPWCSLVSSLSVFILGSDLGIIIGMFVQIDGTPSMLTAVPIIEALAGGTLLYIALCEIIPREKAKKFASYATVFQFIAIFVGFGIMSALTILV